MPFVDTLHRAKPDHDIPGDRCFSSFRLMMREWREQPRWATVDFIATSLWPDPMYRAAFLAFLVFFCLHVMPYELRKRDENGDI